MNPAARRVQRVYLTLLLGNTLAASFIWGINTLFLLDAGLTNFEAFAANAFFTAGMVIFEIPTGVVADTVGRKVSYLLGTVTLSVTTALYWMLWVWHAPFVWWAIVSMLLGPRVHVLLGRRRCVARRRADLHRSYTGSLETVFGRGLVVTGIAMFAGSVLGGIIAQATNLGVPFLMRAGILVVMFVFAFFVMKDLGFTPDQSMGPLKATRNVLEHVDRSTACSKRSVRYVILSAPFASGVGIYAFYALQPYLLELYGDKTAYSIAGLAAAILSLVAGGRWRARLAHPRSVRQAHEHDHRRLARERRLPHRPRPDEPVLAGRRASSSIWGFVFAVAGPVRQAYLNDMIPSKQRATVLSFDSLFGSLGGVFIQPALGRAADLWGYGTSLVIGGVVELIGIPFLFASRRQHDPSDTTRTRDEAAPAAPEVAEP